VRGFGEVEEAEVQTLETDPPKQRIEKGKGGTRRSGFRGGWIRWGYAAARSRGTRLNLFCHCVTPYTLPIGRHKDNYRMVNVNHMVDIDGWKLCARLSELEKEKFSREI
jgi:hypothetical protein